MQPNSLDDADHPGFVERSRRASGTDYDAEIEDEPLYTLYNLGGAPCIMAKLDAKFYLDYQTRRHGVQSIRAELPKDPRVEGSCVRDGDTAVLTMHWSVFNFSLVYTQNPEGNSYYLNKAILKYNQSLESFYDATYRGHISLQTKKGSNYYFTPLGKSYICIEDEDPLELYNVDDERVGNLTLYNIKVQPFVKRAKGKWGPELHCLPKAIRVYRENVVPYAVSLIFVSATAIVVASYGLFRYFHVQKADYHFYEEQQGNQTTVHEGHEMTYVDPSVQDVQVEHHAAPQVPTALPSAVPSAAKAPGAANPFRKDPAGGTNPFNQ